MTIRLDPGSHRTPDRGVCAAEATAFLAGEPHTDHPKCLCPILGETLRWVNEPMAADDRDLLVPLLPLLVGTRAPKAERQRAYRIASAVCRAVRPDDINQCPLETALDWINRQDDADDALAVLEAEDQWLAWLCAEVLYGGPGEIITTALTWLDHVAASGDRIQLWPVMVDGLESATRLGPHSSASQNLLRARERRLEAIQRGHAR